MTDEPQHMTALALANATRIRQGKFRRDIYTLGHADGRELIARLLIGDVEMDEAVSRIPVGRFLGSVYRFGPAGRERALRSAGVVSEDRRVSELTNRQRVALAAAVWPGVLRQDEGQVAA
jgi:hypothetical protein